MSRLIDVDLFLKNTTKAFGCMPLLTNGRKKEEYLDDILNNQPTIDANDTNVPTTDLNKPSQDLNKVSQEHDACDGCKYEESDESVYPCCDCKQNYMDLYKRKPVKTRGDKIRQSNESLLEFIEDLPRNICNIEEDGILEWLNQPEESEEQR